MDFIKKNIVLTVILALTILVSAFLIFLDWKEQSAVSAINSDVTRLTIELREYNNKNPAPVEENYDLFVKDTAIMKERTQDLQRIFGKPYRYPLQKFAESMGVSENDLLSKFRDYCISKPTVTNNNTLLNGFIENLENPGVQEAMPAEGAPQKEPKLSEKGKAAKGVFMKAANERTPNAVNDSNINTSLLQALGVPPTMYATDCKEYIIKTQEGFAKSYASLLTGPLPPNTPPPDSNYLTPLVAKLTFDYQSRVPMNEEIPSIIKKLQLFDDLFWRMSNASITMFNSTELLGNPYGDDAGVKGFTKFSYRIKFTATLPGIRAFVNSLVKAPQNNRYYTIKDFSIQGDDEVVRANQTASVTSAGAAPGSPYSPYMDPSMRGLVQPGMPGAPGVPGAAVAAVEITPESQPDYGKTLIGDSKTYLCTIEFDYYIYIGDELKR